MIYTVKNIEKYSKNSVKTGENTRNSLKTVRNVRNT